MKSQLIQIIRDVPYNSFRSYSRNPLIWPESLGGDCAVITSKLNLALLERKYSPRIIHAENSVFPHNAIVCSDGNSDYYLDAFLMQLEPISLEEVKTKGEASSLCYPGVDSTRKIIIRFLDKEKYSVHFVSEIQGRAKEICKYQFDISKTYPEPISLSPRELADRNLSLDFRFFYEDTLVSIGFNSDENIVLKFRGRENKKIISEDKNFESEIKILKEKFGVDEDIVLPLFYDSFANWKRLTGI